MKFTLLDKMVLSVLVASTCGAVFLIAFLLVKETVE